MYMIPFFSWATSYGGLTVEAGVWGELNTVVYPQRGILLSNEKEQALDTHYNLSESRMHYAT